MLKRRLIPKLQLGLKKSYRGVRPVLVVTKQFKNDRPIGDPLSQAKIYEAQLADELILVDLTRSDESWPVLLKTLDQMSESLATPISVGGGIRNYEQVQQLLDRGADKVVLNSAIRHTPNIIDQVSNSYGSQCVVLSLDYRLGPSGCQTVWYERGTIDSCQSVLNVSNEAIDRGVGELLLTSIDRDGSAQGLDQSLLSEFTSTVSVPVIVSGGCGLAQHFVEGYKMGASAVAAGTFFCHRDQNPMQCRSHIRNAGIPIRLEC